MYGMSNQRHILNNALEVEKSRGTLSCWPFITLTDCTLSYWPLFTLTDLALLLTSVTVLVSVTGAVVPYVATC